MQKHQKNPFNLIRQKIEESCDEHGRYGYNVAGEIIGIITDYNNRVESIEQPDDVLITYPGNPCLGDVINVIVHEGRGAIGRHMNDESNVKYWINRFNEDKDEESLRHINKINKGILDNMQFFTELLRQIEGLGTRPKGFSIIPLREVIETDLVLFTEQFRYHDIECKINGGEGYSIEMSKMDITLMIGNLVLNSIEAMIDDKSKERKITIDVNIDAHSLPDSDYLQSITISDTGPGFDDNMLKNGRCFNAWYSTKSSRLGLGLMVAGEAANRNLLDLQILKTDKGAKMRLVPKEMLA